MARFVDQYPPDEMNSFNWVAAPNFSTQITQQDSGSENANRRWLHPLRRFTNPQGVRTHAVFEAIKDHWLVMGGPAHTWPLRDPTDFASRPLTDMHTVPAITRTDQAIGTGDGVTTQFQLKKRYTRGPQTYDRDIKLPVTSSVLIGLDGIDPAALSPPIGWSVTRLGGVVTFSVAPDIGVAITAGFLFDCEVRFESDDAFQAIVRSYKVSGFADISFQEVRPC